MKDVYKKILIINLGSIGDILLSTPALGGMKTCFSGSQISMLAIKRAHFLTRGLLYIEKCSFFCTGG